MAVRTGSIVLIGGMVYYMPHAALMMAFHMPLMTAKTCLKIAGNTAVIAYDACKITYLLSKRAICRVIGVGTESYSVPC